MGREHGRPPFGQTLAGEEREHVRVQHDRHRTGQGRLNQPFRIRSRAEPRPDHDRGDLASGDEGIQVVGTGDFTHPGWFKELKEKLEPAEEGLFGAPPPPQTLDIDPEHPVSHRIQALAEPGLAPITRSYDDKGKLRSQITVGREATQEQILAAALADANVQKFVGGVEPKKKIVVPGRLVNLVI